MKGVNATNRRNDDVIISALIATPTIKAAALKAEVSDSLIYSRLNDPDFRSKLDKAHSQLMTETMQALKASLIDSVETMYLIMMDTENPPQVRLNAADAIVRNTLKVTERCEIVEQLNKITEYINSKQKGL